jgi:hypothetical protein
MKLGRGGAGESPIAGMHYTGMAAARFVPRRPGDERSRKDGAAHRGAGRRRGHLLAGAARIGVLVTALADRRVRRPLGRDRGAAPQRGPLPLAGAGHRADHLDRRRGRAVHRRRARVGRPSPARPPSEYHGSGWTRVGPPRRPRGGWPTGGGPAWRRAPSTRPSTGCAAPTASGAHGGARRAGAGARRPRARVGGHRDRRHRAAPRRRGARLPGRGQPRAGLVAGLRGHAARRGAPGRAPPGRLVRGGPAGRGRAGAAGGGGAPRPRAGRFRPGPGGALPRGPGGRARAVEGDPHGRVRHAGGDPPRPARRRRARTSTCG